MLNAVECLTVLVWYHSSLWMTEWMNTEKNVIYLESTWCDTWINHFKESQCNKYPLKREQFLPLDEQK